MNVVMLVGSQPQMACGVGDYAARLAEALGEIGVDVTVLTSANARVTPRDGVDGAVQGWGLRHIPSIRAAVLRHRPDVVHIQYPSAGYNHGLAPGLLVLVFRTLQRSLPVVATLHEYRHLAAVHKLYVATTFPFANRVVTPDATQLLGLPAVSRDEVVEIPLAANFGPPTEPLREEHGAELMIGTWGMWREDKGLDVVLDVFDAVASTRPARLVIAGDPGPDERYIRHIGRRIEASPWAGRISRTGRLGADALVATLSSVDVCLLPYVNGLEANRGTYALAQTLGVFTVTTSRVQRGYVPALNTSFVAPADSEAMVEEVQRAPERPARAASDPRAEWKVIANRHRAIYESLHNGA